MEYKIVVEEHAGQRVVHTSITGTISTADRDRIGLETLHKARGNDLSKAIWDIRDAELNYSLIQSHMMVLNLDALGVTDQDYIAVIYFHNKEQNEHASRVARDRSIVNIAYFESFDEGVAWLVSRE